MTSELPVAAPVERHVPTALLPKELRHAHVARRMLERSGIVWTVEQVEALEKKIKTVRQMVNDGKQPAAILPTKIGEEKNGQNIFFRVLIAAQPHTFVFSRVAKGILTYSGAGELKEPSPEIIKSP
jgi:hypothetical protein